MLACLKIEVVEVSCVNMISRMVQFKLLCVPVRAFQECRSTDFFAKEAGYFWTLDKGRQNPEQGYRALDKGRRARDWTRVARTPSRGAEEPRTGVSKDPGQGSPPSRGAGSWTLEPWTRVHHNCHKPEHAAQAWKLSTPMLKLITGRLRDTGFMAHAVILS